MDSIRIPVEFLIQIVQDINMYPLKTEWDFVTSGGNKVSAKRIIGQLRTDNPLNSIDFVYNVRD